MCVVDDTCIIECKTENKVDKQSAQNTVSSLVAYKTKSSKCSSESIVLNYKLKNGKPVHLWYTLTSLFSILVCIEPHIYNSVSVHSNQTI